MQYLWKKKFPRINRYFQLPYKYGRICPSSRNGKSFATGKFRSSIKSPHLGKKSTRESQSDSYVHIAKELINQTLNLFAYPALISETWQTTKKLEIESFFCNFDSIWRDGGETDGMYCYNSHPLESYSSRVTVFHVSYFQFFRTKISFKNQWYTSMRRDRWFLIQCTQYLPSEKYPIQIIHCAIWSTVLHGIFWNLWGKRQICRF